MAPHKLASRLCRQLYGAVLNHQEWAKSGHTDCPLLVYKKGKVNPLTLILWTAGKEERATRARLFLQPS